MSDRFELIEAGIDALLVSPEVEAIVRAQGEKALARAKSEGVQVNRGADRAPMPYVLEVGVVGDRVGALLVSAHPAGIAAEEKYGTLARSVDG